MVALMMFACTQGSAEKSSACRKGAGVAFYANSTTESFIFTNTAARTMSIPSSTRIISEVAIGKADRGCLRPSCGDR